MKCFVKLCRVLCIEDIFLYVKGKLIIFFYLRTYIYTHCLIRVVARIKPLLLQYVIVILFIMSVDCKGN